ncbi:hypothetical protein B0T22DRAFT_514680 [Podospora appendiculata]|uniref:Uncharacterized protein n=1 Tax=Podospora appendiculata TaxID=314037 RepID=A0AAE0XC54_9PEZI|nr:hypothetical protein B0T22DRAFT_514680 [Podospora appendiculata]
MTVYNCRTSNAWAGDLALTVTHFPGQQLTFAIFFGCSEKQENNIIKRLRRAGDDAAHPMLLVGIVADLEHARQMKEVDLKTDELETQIYQLDHETVASRNQSGSSNNQRNMEKRTAWLDTTHARNLLISQLSLLKKMQSHDSEATMMEDPHKDATSEPELMKYYDVEEVIQKAGMSINDRLSTLIGDPLYKTKANKAAQAHGETNMEIATSTGQDSSQMRTIALVTMIFLPGTFFASLFSMTFFNWSPSGDQPFVSGYIWIYFCITLVFTLVTLSVYFLLHRRRKKRGRAGEDSSMV